MRLRALVVVAVLCAAPASPAGAIDPAAGTGGASFMKIGMGSARAMALGRSYVAVAEGSEAINWNPAGLALAQQKEVAYSYLRYIQGIDSPLYIAYAHPFGRTVWGANLAYLSVDLGPEDVRDANGIPHDNSAVQVRDGFASLCVARSFWYEKLFLGGSLKGVHEDNAGSRHSTLVVDFGALLKPNNTISFGFSSQNFGASQAQVARVTRGGVGLKVLELVNLSMEVSKPSDNAARVGLGGEFILPEDLLEVGQVALRVGYYTTDNQGTILPNDRSFLYPLVGAQGLSFGVGLYSSQAFGYGISFDYALAPFGALGTADQLSLKVKF